MRRLLAVVLLLGTIDLRQSSARPLADQHRVTRDAKDVKNSDKEDKLDPLGKEDLFSSKEKKDDELDYLIFEGDIIISPNELRQMTMQDNVQDVPEESRRKRRVEMGSGMSPSQPLIPADKDIISRVWPNCEVPYMFDQRLPNQMRMAFLDAMEIWEDDTCLTFIYNEDMEKDHLFYAEGDICSSHVGRKGRGRQEVTLSEGCKSVGQATHELGHAIGLWHEHSRLDRDNYIRVHVDKIKKRRDYVNFEIISRSTFNEVPDVGYDIQSIMHYSPFAFAASHTPGEETITIWEGADLPELNCENTLEMGQRERLSYKDKKRVNALYDCVFDEVQPECIVPTTTVAETTEPITTMPTPSATITDPTKAPKVKLNTGDILAFSFGDGGYGMQCVPSPGCTPVPCHDFGSNTCHGPDYQFQIINHPSIKSKRIKSSNTVLLRSMNTPTSWLDCSDATRCIISPCTEDNPDDAANSSYISNCSRHHFQVFGVGRGNTQVLNDNHKLKFKYNNSDNGYLNCNGKRCTVLQEGSCPNQKKAVVEFSSDPDTGLCDVESYNVDLLS